MEDVFLHYRPGSASGLGALLQRTEKLLETFPCRPPPVFSPWFRSAAGCPLPIKPAKPPPIITCSSVSWTCTAENRQEKPEESHADRCTGTSELAHENPQELKDIPDSPECFPPTVLPNKAKREITRPSRHKDSVPITNSPVRRCWSVFKQKGVLLRRSQPLSKHFHHMVTVHRLHLHQRVKWVISQHNCGTSRDIEQVWRAVNRSVQSARLPTCNANIQREQAEIWVFCDVVHSEQVGRSLKDELQLSGTIRLLDPRRGDIFSM